ncbi:MAG: TauD/TfdA family dioxygenase [Pseudomonadota bacterium]
MKNPRTERKSLYLASHASHILGWPIEAGREWLQKLTTHATQPQFTYTHRWRRHDLVLWDNRATMHKGSRYEYSTHRRVMVRTTIAGDAPTIDAGRVEQATAFAHQHRAA